MGAFTINGGGGEVEYGDGNIITEGIGKFAQIGLFTTPGYALGGFDVPYPSEQLIPGGSLSNEYAYAESYDYTFTAGASYKINEMLSVAAGLRYVITDKEVDIRGTYTDPLGNSTRVVGAYEQEADGFGGVFGLNVRASETVNIGIRYETKVNLDWDTTVKDVSKGTVGENILYINNRIDGGSAARDLPAVLGIGVEWKVMDKLTLKPSYTLFFEKDADWDTQNSAVDGNSYEIGLAVQYDVNETWSLTAGYLYIDVDMKPENFGIIEKMSPPLDCHAVAAGAKYRVNDRLTFTFGLAGYFYVDDTAPEVPTYVPGVIIPSVTYDKTFYQAGVGIQYSFF